MTRAPPSRRASPRSIRDRSGMEKRNLLRGPYRESHGHQAFSTCFIAVDDHDKALAFYRDVLGLEVRNDVEFEGMRRVSVGSAVAARVDIVLEPPFADPNASLTDKEAAAELLAKGLLRGVIFRTETATPPSSDPRRGRRGAAGADDQPYGVRDCAFRDPSGNMLRFNQPRGQRAPRPWKSVRRSSGRPRSQSAAAIGRPPGGRISVSSSAPPAAPSSSRPSAARARHAGARPRRRRRVAATTPRKSPPRQRHAGRRCAAQRAHGALELVGRRLGSSVAVGRPRSSRRTSRRDSSCSANGGCSSSARTQQVAAERLEPRGERAVVVVGARSARPPAGRPARRRGPR